MTKLEKVKNALERCELYGYCTDEKCPYYECVGCLESLRSDALELMKEEEAKPLRCGGCSWFTQTQESGVGYCSFPNCEREVFDTEYCSWGAWTGKEG